MAEPSEPNRQLTAKEIEDLQEAQRVMDTFLTEMTFETRTPTTAIVGYSELMLQEKLGPINEEQRKGLTEINKTSKFLLKVLNDLLVMRRVLISQIHLNIEEISLSQIIQEAVADTWDHWYITRSSDYPTIEQNVPDGLPNIWVDTFYIKQAITRIILATITSIYRKEDGRIVVIGSYSVASIKLTVTTISKEPLNIYDLNTKLYLSRTIIEKHGGQLSVEKEEESELVISLSLPINQNKPD